MKYLISAGMSNLCFDLIQTSSVSRSHLNNNFICIYSMKQKIDIVKLAMSNKHNQRHFKIYFYCSVFVKIQQYGEEAIIYHSVVLNLTDAF